MEAQPATTNTRGVGLRVRVTESQLQDVEKRDAAQKKAETEQSKPEMISLAAHVTTAWQAALRAKQSDNIEQRFLKGMRRRKGQYDPEKLTQLQKFGGSQIYMMLTNVKCRAAESWIRDILSPPGEKPWALSPTPVPELPEAKEIEIAEQVKAETIEVMMINGISSVGVDKIQERLDEIKDKVLEEKQQKAKKSASRFETHIHDQLSEGSYYKALSEFITDLVTVPTAFIKGPVIRRKKKLAWTEDQEGNYVPAVEIKPVREYQRISGLDIYPSPGAKSVQDGYLCERARLRRSDLQAMIGVEGFKEESIRAVLREYGEGGLRHWLAVDQERARIETRPEENQDPDPPMDCIIFWGSVQGKKLQEWGMDKKKAPDQEMDYQITAWLIGRYVIMARINPHPLAHRPYFSASYDSINDSIWGQCPPEIMEDCQDICNAAARSIVNNMAIASGPQVEVYMNRLQPGENAEDIYPWKIWKTEDDGSGANNPAVNFFQPDPIVDALLKIYEYFFEQASEQTGIPAYVYGGTTGVGNGAGDTASGLSMLMNAAGKTLKGVISRIDENVISPSIKEHWNHVMLYDADIEKMGDINVIARASEQLIIAEQLQLRRSEMLDRTNNDWDKEIIGNKGRAQMLRESFKSMKMDTDKIVPTDAELDAMQAQAMAELGLVNEGAGSGIPPAAVIDAAGNAMGKPPGQTITGRGLRVQ